MDDEALASEAFNTGGFSTLPGPLRIRTLELYIFQTGEIPDSEIPFLTQFFKDPQSDDTSLVALGGVIGLLDPNTPLLNWFMNLFPECPVSTQQLLAPILIASGQGPILPTIIAILNHTIESKLARTIQHAIQYSDLGVFNVVFFALDSATPIGKQRLGAILIAKGFDYCKPFLLALPMNPYRECFANWFGDSFLAFEQEHHLIG